MDNIIQESDYSNTKTNYAVEMKNSLHHDFLNCDTRIDRRVINLPRRKKDVNTPFKIH